MTDNAHAAQRLRAAIAEPQTMWNLPAKFRDDLLAVLDEHAALTLRPAFVIVTGDALTEGGAQKIRAAVVDGRTVLRRRPLSERLGRIADGLFVAASKIEATRPKIYDALITQIIALRVEADQARATEPKGTS